MGKELEPQLGQEVKPPTFLEGLRNYGVNLLKDLPGAFLRISAYILIPTTVAVIMKISGVNDENILKITAGLVVATMAVESCLNERLAKRLPWLSMNHTSSRKER